MNKKIIKILALLSLLAIASFVCFTIFATKGNTDQTNTNASENKTNQINQTNAEETVKRVMDLYYTEVFYNNYALYCGEVDNEDNLDIEVIAGEYAASKTYKDLSSLKAHLSTYLSNELVNSYTKYSDSEVEGYIEENGKLYCHRPARGYEKFTSATYEITNYTENEINFKSNVKTIFAIDETTSEGKGTISLINGKWLLSKYEDLYTTPQTNPDNNDEDIASITKNIMDKYYEEVFHLHTGLYCGEIDKNDILNDLEWDVVGDYAASKTYKNIDEIKTYLKTFIDDELVEEITNDEENPNLVNYIEKGEKVYCYRAPRGASKFISATYDSHKENENTITGTATINTKKENDTTTIKAQYKLSKINNIWKISEYKETN